MPKRKSDVHDENRKRVKRETQQDISKLFKKRKAARKPPVEKPASFSDEWFKSLSAGNNEIDPAGVERLCEQLELEPDSLEVLVLAWKMGATRMGFLSREEWNRGNMVFDFQSAKKLKIDLSQFRAAMNFQSQNAKLLHRFGFDFCRDEGKKILDKETAIIMLHCLMIGRWNLIQTFTNYFKNSSYRGMNRDQWNNVFEFAKVYGSFEDAAAYDPNGAWPVMIDEFVQFVIDERSRTEMS